MKKFLLNLLRILFYIIISPTALIGTFGPIGLILSWALVFIWLSIKNLM